jgi:hypothetical protein
MFGNGGRKIGYRVATGPETLAELFNIKAMLQLPLPPHSFGGRFFVPWYFMT